MLRPFLTLGLSLMVVACQAGGRPTSPATRAVLAPTSSPLPTSRHLLAGLTGRIAYSRGDNIWVMNADGSGKIQLTNAGPGETDYDPSWAPDGTRIAFRSTRAEPGDMEGILVVNVDGSGEFHLTHGYLAGFPAWSPATATIAFARGEGIALIQSDGSALTTLNAEGEYPAWSPDGARLAFMATRDGNDEIYVMNADGSGQTNLTHHAASDAFPAWSPDGTKLAFMSRRDGRNYELYRMNSDGSDVTRLTHSLSDKSFPVWTPDGRIVFNAGRSGAGGFSWVLIGADGSDEAELTQLTAAEANNTIDWLP